MISDIFEEVGMEDIINSTFNQKETKFDETIEKSLTEDNVKKKIAEQTKKMAHSDIDYRSAKELKELSDERRLQPVYIQRFFEKAFQYFGGELIPLNQSVFEIEKFPGELLNVLREDYNMQADLIGFKLCFDKQIFLDYQFNNFGGRMFYVNPGNPVFDALLKVVRNRFREEMMKGAVLVSPEDHEEFLAFIVKSQITDNRPSKGIENVADESIHLVCRKLAGELFLTSPAKLIDLKPPSNYAKNIQKSEPVNEEIIHEWCFSQITLPQYDTTQPSKNQLSDSSLIKWENKYSYPYSLFILYINKCGSI